MVLKEGEESPKWQALVKTSHTGRVFLAFSETRSSNLVKFYLPIQNELKIRPSKSSEENSPVISFRLF